MFMLGSGAGTRYVQWDSIGDGQYRIEHDQRKTPRLESDNE